MTSAILRAVRLVPVVALLALAFGSSPASAQDSAATKKKLLPTIEVKTAAMQKLPGFFPLYWDADAGTLFMEIARLDTEVLHMAGLASGLGSNDIGLDRAAMTGSRIVRFERVGLKVLMVQPNYSYRSSSTNPAEVAGVRDAFARSVLWGFTVVAASDSGHRVLVELNDFLLRDADNIAPRLTPGSYKLDASRSVISMPNTQNFPKNTEMEAELTFVQQPGASSGRGGGGAYFEGVGRVAATGQAASLRVHQSFVELPDSGFTKRAYDPRSGFGDFTYDDYSAPLGQPLEQRFIPRHRLKKVDPSAAISDPVQPIIYYVDPGTPEPIRSALMAGARWWNQAFEAAGYRNAFRVELLPRRRLTARHPLQHDQLGAPFDPRLELWRQRGRSAHRRDHQGRGDAGVVAGAAGLDGRRGVAAAVQERRRSGPGDPGVGACSGCASSPRTRWGIRSASTTTTTTVIRGGSA